jgi:hypothetical protein
MQALRLPAQTESCFPLWEEDLERLSLDSKEESKEGFEVALEVMGPGKASVRMSC